MKFLEPTIEKIRAVFRPAADQVKRQLFGANNERLDFIMDSFYKLTPKQQTGAVVGFFAGILVLVMVIFGVYFARLKTLENDLNAGYEALREINRQAHDYKVARARMDWLKQSVENKSGEEFRPKPYFEKVANRVGVTLEALKSDEVEIAKDNPLSLSFKEIQISFRMPKVSIPRLLKFLTEIEKSGQTLTVRDLKIRARYGDRLYFDTEALVTGYKKI